MLRPHPFWFGLFLLVVSSIANAGEPRHSGTLDTKGLDEYLAKQVADKGFVGLSVALMEDGKITFAKGYGKGSLKSDTNVSAETLFAAGSVTKQFACACVLLLAEDGKLSIHDKVAKYYPDLTRAKDISLYDLMTHVSGYPDYYPLDFIDRRMMKTIPPDKLIQEYAGGKLDFEPGTRWSYSNTGYIILGRVVEKVSGKPFDQFLTDRILKPAGMTNTAFEPKKSRKDLAVGYTSFALGKPEEAIPEAEGWIHAAGGLFTTPTDLAKWDLALMEGKLLKPDSYQTMIAPRKLSDGRVRNYACGLGVTLRDGESVIRHSGAVSGYHAYNAMMPRTKSAVILMTNCEHLDDGALNTEIVNRLFKAQSPADPEIPKIKGLTPKEAALDLFHQMQTGEIKRDNLGEEFNHFLSEERVASAKDRLKTLGEPDKVEVEATAERGGMEVAVIRFTFKEKKVKGSLYRRPDGKVQQFLLYGS
jgi:CubicO group peptidase (beta-lactamase class C family)